MSDQSNPGRVFASITKSDSTDLTDLNFRGLYVGATGDVAIVDRDGNSITFVNLAAGVIHPIAGFKKVMSTGTSATGIVGVK